MKILSIGNSFSQDPHKWLHAIAQNAGADVTCFNLYIGGCSLAQHAENLKTGRIAYRYEINAVRPGVPVSLPSALEREAWDVVTVQQKSNDSGIPETFEPHLSEIVAAVRRAAPTARLCFQETWSYECDSTHPAFVNYGRDEAEMHRRIKETSHAAATRIGADLIPVGDVIEALRHEVPAFDRAKGGIPLTRDGFHLSFDYGRYAAGLTWFAFLTGADARRDTFVPVVDGKPADPALLVAIRETVARVLKKEN